jgi:hypothetical protein
MGVDILYFLDHDLPVDNIQNLYNELKMRIPDKEIILCDCGKTPFYNIKKRKNVWYVLYGYNYPDVSLHYEDDIYTIHPVLYKNTAECSDIEMQGNSAFNYLRWWQMIEYFKNNETNGREWFLNMITSLKTTLQPIFHSKKVLLTADSSSYTHETMYGDFLADQGKTIDEALEMNNTFNPPCNIWKNKEAFGRPETDYDSLIDNDCGGPFFLFDLDKEY